MTKEKKELLSKSGSGRREADVANTAIRNILWLLSADNIISEKDIEETEEFFDWKCPYTGEDLRERIYKRDRVAMDHIVPQNKKWCGLNVKGNLVWVDSGANTAKTGITVEEFLLNDETVLHGTSEEERKKRLERIREFQDKCGYDPDKIKSLIGPELEIIYQDIEDRQKDLAMELEKLLTGDTVDREETDKSISNRDNDEGISKIKRNTDKYIVNGVEYSKRGLALFVIEDYVKNNPNTTYAELSNIFNMKLEFDGKPIVRLAESVSQKEKDASRVYWKTPISLMDGVEVVVNTQWQQCDMPAFIKIIEDLGYIVQKKEY